MWLCKRLSQGQSTRNVIVKGDDQAGSVDGRMRDRWIMDGWELGVDAGLEQELDEQLHHRV